MGEEKYQTLLFKVQLVVTGVRLRLVVDILVIFAVIPLLIIFIRAAFQKNMVGDVGGHGGRWGWSSKDWSFSIRLLKLFIGNGCIILLSH